MSTHTIDPNGSGDYTTLQAWDSAQQKDITAAGTNEIAKALCINTGTGADSTACQIAGWTTDATHYVWITGESDPHGGVWNTSTYRLELSWSAMILQLDQDYTLCEYIQIGNTSNVGEGVDVGAGGCTMNACIVRNTGGGNGTYGIQHSRSGDDFYLRNTVVYGWDTNNSISVAGNSASGTGDKVYNCTVDGNGGGTGYNAITTAPHVWNCIAQNCTDGFAGTWASGDYNCSDVTSDAPGSNSQTGTVTFNGAGDYRLSSSDTVAKDNGTSLSSDTDNPVTKDFIGTTRPSGSGWDIGAHELIQAASVIGRITAVQLDLTYTQKTAKATATQLDVTYTEKTGRVTAAQVDATHDVIGARATAADLFVTFTEKTARATAVELESTYTEKTARATAVEIDAIHSLRTGKITAVEVDLLYTEKTARATAVEVDATYTEKTARATAADLEITFTEKTGRVTAIEVDATHDVIGARATAAQIDITYSQTVSVIGKITAIQVDLTYTEKTARATAAQVDATYTEKTARATAVELDATHDVIGARVTASDLEITYTEKTGRITAAQVDTTYSEKTARVTAAQVDTTFSEISAKITATDLVITYSTTAATARMTAIQVDIEYSEEAAQTWGRILRWKKPIRYNLVQRERPRTLN